MTAVPRMVPTLADDGAPRPLAEDAPLRVVDLRKVYGEGGKNPVAAVDGVSFDVAQGEVVGLLGPNGAGKTTTMRCASGLTVPTSGRVTCFGTDVVEDRRAVARKLGLLLEGTRCVYWRMTVRENLDFFAGLHGIRPADIRSRRDELIEVFGLTGKAKTAAAELSRGMQQKLSLACVLVRSPAVLLLDEPTLGLDVETTADLRRFIRNLATDGKAIVVSTHDMSLVESLCDRAVIIRDGSVVADDSVKSMMRLFHTKTLRVVLGGVFDAEDIAERTRGAAPVLSVEAGGSSTAVEFAIVDWAVFYTLVRELQRGGFEIQDITTKQSGMEDVFLRTIRGEGLDHTHLVDDEDDDEEDEL